MIFLFNVYKCFLIFLSRKLFYFLKRFLKFYSLNVFIRIRTNHGRSCDDSLTEAVHEFPLFRGQKSPYGGRRKKCLHTESNSVSPGIDSISSQRRLLNCSAGKKYRVAHKRRTNGVKDSNPQLFDRMQCIGVTYGGYAYPHFLGV